MMMILQDSLHILNINDLYYAIPFHIIQDSGHVLHMYRFQADVHVYYCTHHHMVFYKNNILPYRMYGNYV